MKNHIKYILTISFCLFAFLIIAQNATVSGQVLKADAAVSQNVTVELIGNNYAQTVNTDNQGNYIFEGVPADLPLTITVKKDDNHLNGVSTFDLVVTVNHILGLSVFTEKEQYIAMDANKSGVITAFDLIQLRQLVLGLIPELPNNDAWRFIETSVLAALTIGQDELLGNPTPTSPFTVSASEAKVINFTAIKVGDANGNATP